MLFEIGDENPVVQEIIATCLRRLGVGSHWGFECSRSGDEGPRLLLVQGVNDESPCAEPVDWFVMLELGTVSQAQSMRCRT